MDRPAGPFGDEVDVGSLNVVVAMLVSVAVAVALLPRPGVSRLRVLMLDRHRGRPREPDRANNRRPSTGPRTAAALLAAVASAAIVGGAGGWVFALVVGLATWIGLGRLEPAAVVRRRPHIASVMPLAAELLAAAVAAGAPPARAAETVGAAIGGPLGEALSAAGAASRVGADPVRAWARMVEDPTTRSLGRAMLRSTARGTSPVAMLERVARDARDTARWTAEARARSVGAKAAAPLGLCFLPAFILVGIVPLVATLGLPLLP